MPRKLFTTGTTKTQWVDFGREHLCSLTTQRQTRSGARRGVLLSTGNWNKCANLLVYHTKKDYYKNNKALIVLPLTQLDYRQIVV
jgi:hypothetical protein